MQATVTVEVPPGTDVIVLRIITPDAGVADPKSRRKHEPAVALSAVAVINPAPRGPRGPQLWLRYPGWECDAFGWRLLGP